MEDEVIKPWVQRYTDPRGIEVETVGVDIVNHRVIFRYADYPYECVCPRRDWPKKFRKVEL
ncbi:DUF4222 domain-containing protein [Rosenbergiella collisarenosi]|uniref:DUF4222 domain-containing protein n=1 Tax=Rosenbergiella collisarenosi TaxID=1544695 RepID=UPI001BDAFC83|nr:DUF4222 domain-containing protein [Rosenbergiella collisarenosi]MBT0720568.1 DUF4222 domain-containing protein [Rosenbergiella collisarenosi]